MVRVPSSRLLQGFYGSWAVLKSGASLPLIQEQEDTCECTATLPNTLPWEQEVTGMVPNHGYRNPHLGGEGHPGALEPGVCCQPTPQQCFHHTAHPGAEGHQEGDQILCCCPTLTSSHAIKEKDINKDIQDCINRRILWRSCGHSPSPLTNKAI